MNHPLTRTPDDYQQWYLFFGADLHPTQRAATVATADPAHAREEGG
jgi:hypothetical protein